MKYFYILLLAGFLSVGGFFGYKRWKHRYICIPPDAIWDVTCGHADDLKHAEPVDVGEFDEPVLPREPWFYNGVPKEGTAVYCPNRTPTIQLIPPNVDPHKTDGYNDCYFPNPKRGKK